MWHVAPFVFSKKVVFYCMTKSGNHIGRLHIYMWCDFELSDSLSEVCVRDLQCYDPLEKLYYSMNYEPICIHCCSEDNLVSVQGCYPQCESCTHKEPVKKSLKQFFFILCNIVHAYVTTCLLRFFVRTLCCFKDQVSREVFT